MIYVLYFSFILVYGINVVFSYNLVFYNGSELEVD